MVPLVAAPEPQARSMAGPSGQGASRDRPHRAHHSRPYCPHAVLSLALLVLPLSLCTSHSCLEHSSHIATCSLHFILRGALSPPVPDHPGPTGPPSQCVQVSSTVCRLHGSPAYIPVVPRAWKITSSVSAGATPARLLCSGHAAGTQSSKQITELGFGLLGPLQRFRFEQPSLLDPSPSLAL